MRISTPVIRYHGGKFRLAPWIIQHLPPHRCYVEPFGGAAGVLIQKPRAYAEVYNDLDGDVVNLFRVLRDPAMRAELTEQLLLTPYARAEFEQAWMLSDNPIEQARRLIIRAQMGFGSAGATKGSTGFRIDTKRAYGTAQQLWAAYPEALASIGQRLAGVLIENRPAIEVMQAHDAPDTLHFVDPPYVFATRELRNTKGCYRHEMTDEQHVELLQAIKQLQGMVAISGYPSDLYTEHLRGWQMVTTPARISAGRGTTIRTECLWLSPSCRQSSLFTHSENAA